MLRLQVLPPTSEIARDLDDALAARTGDWGATHTLILRDLLADCQERDKLQETRPDGCWCLGLGGRDRRYLPDVAGLPSVSYWGAHCTCPDGERAAAFEEHEMRIYARTVMELRAQQLLETSGFERNYQGATLTTVRLTGGTYQVFSDVVQRYALQLDAPSLALHDTGSLYLWGRTGTGKTWLGIAVVRELMANLDTSGMAISMVDLLDAIRETYHDKAATTTAALLNRLEQAPVLLLDDLGAEKVTDWSQERLYRLVNARSNAHLPTVFTSNYNTKALADRVGPRIAGRIVEMCGGPKGNLVEWAGPDWRLTDWKAAAP